MDNNTKGLISVIMGIYNCSTTLTEAVQSIKCQTYPNWQLILCDDGSTDNTLQVATNLAKEDDRIIVLANKVNQGLNITLNKCLQHATGEYIARMDGDDRCVPTRFQMQIDFLNEHPDYPIVSSWMDLFDENGVWGMQKTVEYPTKEQVVTGSPICHAPVMMKRECIEKVHGYTCDNRMLRVEDVNLWIKLYTAGYSAYNIQTALYQMRNDKNALARRKYKYRINSTYTRLLGAKAMHLPAVCYIKAFRPMIVGLVPAKIRQLIRRKSG